MKRRILKLIFHIIQYHLVLEYINNEKWLNQNEIKNFFLLLRRENYSIAKIAKWKL